MAFWLTYGECFHSFKRESRLTPLAESIGFLLINDILSLILKPNLRNNRIPLAEMRVG
jgi:hypothetical protein